MKHWAIFVIVVMLGLMLAACEDGPSGRLEGMVTVGPLQPVVQEGVPEPPPAPEVYTSRGVNIFKAGGRTLVKKVMFSETGSYEVELPVGSYLVELIPNGVDFSRELPTEVEIHEDETTRLDLDIDTGIR